MLEFAEILRKSRRGSIKIFLMKKRVFSNFGTDGRYFNSYLTNLTCEV